MKTPRGFHVSAFRALRHVLISLLTASGTQVFNEYIPTADGPTPNKLFSYFGQTLSKPIVSWDRNLPWSGMVLGCPEQCTATIKAPALAQVACASQLIPVNYTYTPDVTNFLADTGIAPPVNELAFAIVTSLLINNQRESINLVTAYESNHDCIGTLNLTACTLESAIGE